jgi:DNA-binding Xre family transcriptional regulator
MKEKGATTYTLRVKGGISGSTLIRLQNDMSVSTNTLDSLCKTLNCDLHNIVTYIPD